MKNFFKNQSGIMPVTIISVIFVVLCAVSLYYMQYDLTATNCGTNCACERNNSNSNIWLILILLFCCGGNGGCGGGGFLSSNNGGCGCDIIIILLLLSCCGGGNGLGCFF